MSGLLGTIFDSEIAFEIAGRPIRWYGIFVTLGILLAYFLYLLLAHKRRIDIDFSLEAFIWVVVCAVIFCRLFYVLPREEYYPIDSWEAFVRYWDISQGGLTIVGGIFGGALGLLCCCLRNKKYSFTKVADCVVLCVLLGQIIGRWGNYANQELYGQVVTDPAFQKWPFAVFIDATGHWHQALYIYEGVLNLIGLVIGLVLFYKYKKLRNFTISLFYIFWYGLVRGSLEFLKVSHETFPGTDIGIIQVICYCACIVALMLMILNQKGIIRFQSKKFNTDGDLFPPTEVPDDFEEKKDEYLKNGIPGTSFAGLGKPRRGEIADKKIYPTIVPDDFIRRKEYYLRYGIPGTSYYGEGRGRYGEYEDGSSDGDAENGV